MNVNCNLSRFDHCVLGCLSFILWLAPNCTGQIPIISTDNSDNALKIFLQKELSSSMFGTDKSTRYSSSIIKSDDSTAEEIVVYFSGQSWCGSGGCRMMILEKDRESFKVIGNVTIVHPPILVFKSKSHGRYDIGVWVQGGGILPGYEALLRFDGRSYPSNPSVPPAVPLNQGTTGRVLIARGEEGQLLYQ